VQRTADVNQSQDCCSRLLLSPCLRALAHKVLCLLLGLLGREAALSMLSPSIHEESVERGMSSSNSTPIAAVRVTSDRYRFVGDSSTRR